jgi:hypothetical protein
VVKGNSLKACKYNKLIVNGNNNVKEWIGVHSSLVVSLHKVNNNMLGKKIIVGQMIE